jgi:hypothetical protein
VPAGEQAGDLARGDARGQLGEEALLGHGIEAAEQSEALIGDECHDMAVALDRPELEGERGPQGMLGRDHARARQGGMAGERGGVEADEIGDKQEEAPESGGEAPRGEGELASIGGDLDGGSDACGPLLVEAPGQAGKAFGLEQLTDRSGAERRALVAQGLTDLIDRQVALAQGDDVLAGLAFPGLGLRPVARRGEEVGQLAVAELVAEDAKGTG